MQKYYATLNEKDRRRYAAMEALKLGMVAELHCEGVGM